MYVEKKRADGIKVTHAGGEIAITDKELDLSMALPSMGKPFSEDQLKAIEDRLESHDDFVKPMVTVTRVDGIFARLDLGGYFSPWVVGEDLEEVMEQLDDIYGVYDDYL